VKELVLRGKAGRRFIKIHSENGKKAKEQKEPELSSDVCSVECGKWKLGRLPRN